MPNVVPNVLHGIVLSAGVVSVVPNVNVMHSVVLSTTALPFITISTTSITDSSSVSNISSSLPLRLMITRSRAFISLEYHSLGFRFNPLLSLNQEILWRRLSKPNRG
ncbi:hypothetical protein U1Q18_002972 [Sarracenia purpurea var. burkii]